MIPLFFKKIPTTHSNNLEYLKKSLSTFPGEFQMEESKKEIEDQFLFCRAYPHLRKDIGVLFPKVMAEFSSKPGLLTYKLRLSRFSSFILFLLIFGALSEFFLPWEVFYLAFFSNPY